MTPERLIDRAYLELAPHLMNTEATVTLVDMFCEVIACGRFVNSVYRVSVVVLDTRGICQFDREFAALDKGAAQ
jgi:hypothetical protein